MYSRCLLLVCQTCLTFKKFINQLLPLWCLEICHSSENIYTIEISKHYHDLLSYHSQVKVIVAQSCPILCKPMVCSLPGSSVHGIFQARLLEWVAISFSRGTSRLRDRSLVSRICRQTLYRLSHKGSPQEYRSGLHFLLQGIFLTQGSNLHFLHWQVDSLPLSHHYK